MRLYHGWKLPYDIKNRNNDKGLLIGNNKGHINGWTKQVYGKVIEIFIMEIEKVKAYKISDKLFETIEEANDYKYQKIDNVELGDIVSTNGGFKNFYGNFGLEGKVCCIEGDLIWFLDGNCPQEWIMTGKIKYSCDILKIKNRTYSWKVMARYRKDLWRRPLSWLD